MKPGMGWPIAVAAILGATVVANLAVMRIANSDPSFAIEPDYYAKAIAFDSTAAASRRSAGLHWMATAATNATKGAVAVRAVAVRTLEVTLTDSLGQPITGARVTAEALFVGRANRVLSATLTESTPGHYEAPAAAMQRGQWEVRVTAIRGDAHFVTRLRTEVPAS